ncbi:hypothetical protein D3C72_2155000 [compost metagenome]
MDQQQAGAGGGAIGQQRGVVQHRNLRAGAGEALGAMGAGSHHQALARARLAHLRHVDRQVLAGAAAAGRVRELCQVSPDRTRGIKEFLAGFGVAARKRAHGVTGGWRCRPLDAFSAGLASRG